jgi:hypothetical protein
MANGAVWDRRARGGPIDGCALRHTFHREFRSDSPGLESVVGTSRRTSLRRRVRDMRGPYESCDRVVAQKSAISRSGDQSCDGCFVDL